MLQKKARLDRKAFDHHFKVGKRLHSTLFQAIVSESRESHGSAVVGKKVAKRAVDRNKLRRRMYGVLYPYLKSETKPQTVILIAKKGVLEIPRKQYAQELRQLLERIFAL